MKIVFDEDIPYLSDFFQDQAHLVGLSANEISPQTVKNADALIVRSVTPVNEELLKTSTVRFVGSTTAGTDHLDIEYLEQAKINWTYAPGCNARAVANYVLLSVAHLIHANIFKKKQVRAGVIGVGHVGRLVVSALHKLGFDVVLNDPIRAKKEIDFISTPLEDFFDLDFICIHTPLTRSGPYPSHHLINSDFLSQLNPNCVLLNAGRGECVDTEALQKTNLVYVLDVWENEPNININIAKSAFIATPHIAGYSQPAKYRATKQVYENFCQHFEVDIYRNPEENLDDFVRIDFTKSRWIDDILQVENLLTLTKKFIKEIEISKNPISDAFTHFRKTYKYRAEIF